MAKITKKQKESLSKFDKAKSYGLNEAVEVVKGITYTSFDASVDLDVRLGVDPRKANQMVRGIVTLPHGTGKVVRVLALVTPDKNRPPWKDPRTTRSDAEPEDRYGNDRRGQGHQGSQSR
jgi:large subunit ribosomal protein L1